MFEMLKQMVVAGLPRKAGRRLPDREQGWAGCLGLLPAGGDGLHCSAVPGQEASVLDFQYKMPSGRQSGQESRDTG